MSENKEFTQWFDIKGYLNRVAEPPIHRRAGSNLGTLNEIPAEPTMIEPRLDAVQIL